LQSPDFYHLFSKTSSAHIDSRLVELKTLFKVFEINDAIRRNLEAQSASRTNNDRASPASVFKKIHGLMACAAQADCVGRVIGIQADIDVNNNKFHAVNFQKGHLLGRTVFYARHKFTSLEKILLTL